ncbi:MAG TPA: hypothetical protein VF062_19435 [Candidatus Limnocylindrales bacterium]
MTPEPPREYVAFVAKHLRQLRHDAELLAGDEYEAHELYSQALTDIAIRWPWFVVLRRLNRPDAADEYLHETLIRRSARREAEQADFVEVEVEVWFSGDPRATHPAPVAAPTRSSATARTLPMASFGIEIGPVTEAAVAWWHARVAYYHARLGATTAAVTLALAIVLPFLQRH